MKKWYAVQYDRDDNEWGTGSFDLEEAIKMCRENGYKRIAVIDMDDTEPVCIDEMEVE